jgi:hypothetical protein
MTLVTVAVAKSTSAAMALKILRYEYGPVELLKFTVLVG